MLDMIKYIVEQFAEKKDEIEYIVDENPEEKVVNVTIILAESDMGKVIGRQGKIAKALRTLVKTKASESKLKYNVEIREKGEQL